MNYFRQKGEALDSAWVKGNWAARALIFVLVAAFLWASGLFWKYPQGFDSLVHFPRLADFLKLCADPLTRNLHEPIVAYRLTTPVVSYMLGLGPGLSVLLGWLALALSYATCWVALRKHTGSLYALLIVFGLSQSFFAHASIRWLGIPDSVTMLALSCCLVSGSPWIVAGATFLGIMNDERFLLGAPALLAWHLLSQPSRPRAMSPAPASTDMTAIVKLLWPVVVALLGGIVAAMAIRHALTVGWIGSGIGRLEIYESMASQPVMTVGWQPYGSSWPLFFFNVVMSWTWMWIYALHLIGKGLFSVNRTMAIVFGAYFVGAIASTALVIDVSRSMGFLFPVFVAGALSLHLACPKRSLRVAAAVALLMALTPGIYYGTRGSGAVFIPYPLELANDLSKDIAGVDVLEAGKRFFSFKDKFSD